MEWAVREGSDSEERKCGLYHSLALSQTDFTRSFSSTFQQVVFLTDGKPNIGETRPEQLRRNVREANLHQLPVFTLALGQDADVR